MEKERVEVVHGDGEKVNGWGGGRRRRWCARPAIGGGKPRTESGDGYRGSSAIIGAESSFFSLLFFFPFFSTSDIDLGEAVGTRGTSVPRDSRRRRRRRRRRRDASRHSERASRGTTSLARMAKEGGLRERGSRAGLRARMTEGRCENRQRRGTVGRASVIPLHRKVVPPHGPRSPTTRTRTPTVDLPVGNLLASPPANPTPYPCTAVGSKPDVSFSTTLPATAATTINLVSRQERTSPSNCPAL